MQADETQPAPPRTMRGTEAAASPTDTTSTTT